ncbi:hypothetical protein NQ317_014525 [Molorchus minor]|uniref:Uncharacterized protein n=1 Tax=Molorchus minor TaxID=1323400 RepID=A0ABQ9JB42_9CUCU|nr:hypothetical protein NQ317_014525 [Molorchus minor]
MKETALGETSGIGQVLQNPLDSPVSSPTNPHNKSSLPSTTRKLIYRRRASIATFSQPTLR